MTLQPQEITGQDAALDTTEFTEMPEGVDLVTTLKGISTVVHLEHNQLCSMAAID